VDDSAVNLRLTKRKIQLALGESVQVQTANDGIEGIEAYEALIADGKQSMLRGIFMDYHMPRCSGSDAMIAIRRIERENGLRPCYIAAFTADLSETSSQELMNAGANEVLPKPTPAGLLESLCMKLVRA
jgi:CheY-like chemotaxis protein